MKNNRFNIIGNGAIGHLWTGFMLRKEINALLYTRNLKSKKKVLFDSPIASFETQISYLTLDDWQLPDYILICVKAHQLDELCQKLKTKETKNCPIILMMNGLGLVEIAKKYFPSNPILHASITHGALKKGDTLFHTGLGQTLIGNLSSMLETKFTCHQTQFSHLISELNTALPEVYWSENHQENLMIKMIINSIINPVTALLRINNGELLYNDKLIPIAQKLLDELQPLIKILLPSYSIQEITTKIINVIKNTVKNQSSMLIDINNNQLTEIEFINGYLIKLAKKHHIGLTSHQLLVQEIQQLNKN